MSERTDMPTYPEFAITRPWYRERLVFLKKWTINWTRGYDLADEAELAERDRLIRERVITEPRNFGNDPIMVRDPETPKPETPKEVTTLVGAEAVSSEDVKTGRHMILLDIDHHCELIPSSRKGHYHLYIQMGMMGEGLTWEQYEPLLKAMAEAGMIEKGYYEVSKQRKATFLRLPWIRKGHELEDRQRTLGEWLDEPADPDPF